MFKNFTKLKTLINSVTERKGGRREKKFFYRTNRMFGSMPTTKSVCLAEPEKIFSAEKNGSPVF